MGEALSLARLLIEELIERGVGEAVLCPGSRSAPLAYAAYSADQQGRIRLHVRIDERTGGFLALGLAKQRGAPVAVITTSGTAAANLHPAVLEAWHSHLPLIMITASRPRSMINTGANQTTDQEQLFGRHVRGYAGLSDTVAEPAVWRYELARVIIAATGVRNGQPGPVQLNVEFSEPLAPDSAAAIGPLPPAVRVPASARVSDVASLPAGPRTVIVAGDLPVAAGRRVAEIATSARVPLLAEPSSNARRGPAALGTQRLLAGSRLSSKIQRVVVYGHPTLSRPISALLSRGDVELIMVAPYADWIDPGVSASRIVDDVAFAEAALDEAGDDWLSTWQRADDTVRSQLDALLRAQPVLTGPSVAAALWSCLGGDEPLFLGSSNPIRDCDLTAITFSPPAVYANRGLAGIDGSVSTAVGLALSSGAPTRALLGDVTALHDLTGLVIGPDEPRPDLQIVVANDDGGSIFATLDHGDPAHARSFERLFATPHRARFAALADAVGAAHYQVQTINELQNRLDHRFRGIQIIEAVVDREQRRSLQAQITGLAATI